MKTKSFISLLCLTLGVFLFQACNDVPAPYDIPGKGDANSIYGTGSKESPYTIKGAALNQNGGYAWVKAYIVGYIPTGDNTSSTISDIVFGTEGAGTTNIVIATSADSKDINHCMAVQLPSGDVRNALNLQAPPEHLGKEVMLYGPMQTSFGSAGVNPFTPATLAGQEIGDVPEEPGDAIFSETFAEGMGEFTINNVNVPSEMGSEVWTFDSYKYMKATSYINGVNYAAESWLVSPAINLTQASAATLTFDYCARYFNDLENNMTVWNTEASNENWQKLPVEIKDCSDWNFVDSKDIDLNAYKGKSIKLAFVYNCTDKAGTFELKNILVEERNAQADPPIPGANLIKNGGFEVVKRVDGAQTDGMTKELNEILSSGTKVEVIMCADDQMAEAVRATVKESGKNDILIYSIGGSPAAKAALLAQEGAMAGIGARSPIIEGKIAVKTADAILDDGSYEEEVLIETFFINKENVEIYGTDGWQ